MNGKPDVVVVLAIIVAVGAVLTGAMSPDHSQPAVIASESMIR